MHLTCITNATFAFWSKGKDNNGSFSVRATTWHLQAHIFSKISSTHFGARYFNLYKSPGEHRSQTTLMSHVTFIKFLHGFIHNLICYCLVIWFESFDAKNHCSLRHYDCSLWSCSYGSGYPTVSVILEVRQNTLSTPPLHWCVNVFIPVIGCIRHLESIYMTISLARGGAQVRRASDVPPPPPVTCQLICYHFHLMYGWS